MGVVKKSADLKLINLCLLSNQLMLTTLNKLIFKAPNLNLLHNLFYVKNAFVSIIFLSFLNVGLPVNVAKYSWNALPSPNFFSWRHHRNFISDFRDDTLTMRGEQLTKELILQLNARYNVCFELLSTCIGADQFVINFRNVSCSNRQSYRRSAERRYRVIVTYYLGESNRLVR